MLKNENGITALILIVTVIVMIILTGVVVQVGSGSVKDIKASRKIANMKLVKAKVETIWEEKQFNNENNLEGEKKSISYLKLSSLEKKILDEEGDISSWEWYEWGKEELMNQGLDVNMLSEGQVYFVNYEHTEILYTAPTKYEDTPYYSLTGLENMFLENY